MKQNLILIILTLAIIGCGTRSNCQCATVGIYDKDLNISYAPLSCEMTEELKRLISHGGKPFEGFGDLKIAADTYIYIDGVMYDWYGTGGVLVDDRQNIMYHSEILREFWDSYDNDPIKCRNFVPRK